VPEGGWHAVRFTERMGCRQLNADEMASLISLPGLKERTEEGKKRVVPS